MIRLPMIKETLTNLFRKPVTRVGTVEAFEGYRGAIEFKSDLCIACGLCIRVCSPGAITKTQTNIEGGQEIKMSFDLGSCTFCGMCADFCSKKAIVLTKNYNMVFSDKNTFIVGGSFIKKIPPKVNPTAKPKV